ncbi:unnamed protein product [Pylaiella littoralis]
MVLFSRDKSTPKTAKPQQQPTIAREHSSCFVSAASLPSSKTTRATAPSHSPPSSSSRAHGGSSAGTHATQQHRQPSSSDWASSASGSTVVDSSSGFAGQEAPGSPAAVAARHAAASGHLFSDSSGSSHGQERRLGRLGKLKLKLARSSCSDTPSKTERKRKARTAVVAVSKGPPVAGFQVRSDMNVSRQPGYRRLVNNRFEIHETLGTGYSGKVKRATDIRTGQTVALKVMDKLNPGDPRTARRLERLHREVDAMTRCASHLHTVTLLDAMFGVAYPKRNGQPQESSILVLEFCERGELFALLSNPRRGPVPPVVCKEYFRQLMDGIKFCHDQGVCHRDLKPENLLLDADFNLKIADFGFAAAGPANMLCESIVGSKAFMAPEVVGRLGPQCYNGRGYEGAKADVWSAGVILFTMLAGHAPLERAVETDWWFRVLQIGRPDLFWQSHANTSPHFPEEAKHLVTVMLTVEPSHRISVDQILAHPYLAASPDPHFRLWSGHGAASQSPQECLLDEMQARYADSMATNRLCVVAPRSPRGTADSAGTEQSSSPSAAASVTSSAALAGRRVPNQYAANVNRCAGGDDHFEVPFMTEEDAAKVTRGFMASGSVRNVIKAISKELFDMGAQIEGVNRDGTRDFKETFEVSAVIRTEEKSKGGDVCLLAKVFRVVPTDVPKREQDQADGGTDAPPPPPPPPGAAAGDKLVVVLRRRQGDYHRYRNVEDALVSRLTTEVESEKEEPVKATSQSRIARMSYRATKDKPGEVASQRDAEMSNVNMSPTP